MLQHADWTLYRNQWQDWTPGAGITIGHVLTRSCCWTLPAMQTGVVFGAQWFYSFISKPYKAARWLPSEVPACA